MQPSISSKMSDRLLTPFTISELHDAISALDAYSCPGNDGLTRDLFLQYWDTL